MCEVAECTGQLIEDGCFLCCVECGTSKPCNNFIQGFMVYQLEPLQSSQYCRHSRFRRYINQQPRTFNRIQKTILCDAFSLLEGAWVCIHMSFKRKYFISQSVVLFVLCKCLLKIELEPPLRSPDRVNKQVTIAKKLIEHARPRLQSRFEGIVDFNLVWDWKSAFRSSIPCTRLRPLCNLKTTLHHRRWNQLISALYQAYCQGKLWYLFLGILKNFLKLFWDKNFWTRKFWKHFRQNNFCFFQRKNKMQIFFVKQFLENKSLALQQMLLTDSEFSLEVDW